MAERCVACHENISAQLPDATKLHGAIKNQNPNSTCRDCHPEHRGASAPLTDLRNNTFPHEALGFSLSGHQLTSANATFACRDCHPDDIATFNRSICDSCHRQIDAAFTQTHTTAFGTDCLACHDGVDRLGKKNFSHTVFPFKLDGKHAGTACEKCHPNARKLADLKAAPQDCNSCHQKDDKHQGKWLDCAKCHAPDSWKNAKFDHNLAAFKLEAKHNDVACEKCHINSVFQGTPKDCYSCHQKDDKHQGGYGQDCAACHKPTKWDDANVDHNLFAFKLESSHAQVKCEACHLNGVFKGTPADCYSCHQKDDQHQGKFGKDCSACHAPTKWGDATFDHSRSNFLLSGGHAKVACERCHVNGKFAGTSTACVSCHADPAFHAGAFGTNCKDCHGEFSWSRAKYNLSHPLVAGGEGGSGINHGGASCKECHPSTVYNATCVACHSGGFEGGGRGGD
jgi:hypothetical protein